MGNFNVFILVAFITILLKGVTSIPSGSRENEAYRKSPRDKVTLRDALDYLLDHVMLPKRDGPATKRQFLEVDEDDIEEQNEDHMEGVDDDEEIGLRQSNDPGCNIQ